MSDIVATITIIITGTKCESLLLIIISNDNDDDDDDG